MKRKSLSKEELAQAYSNACAAYGDSLMACDALKEKLENMVRMSDQLKDRAAGLLKQVRA